jgi:cell division protein FtsB
MGFVEGDEALSPPDTASATLRRGQTRTGISQRRIFLILSLALAAFILFFPARQLVDQRQHINSLEERLVTLGEENKRLEQEVGRLSDPGELEVEARKRLGLVKPGERLYYLDGSGRPDQAPPATQEDDRSWFDRAWDWIKTLIRGRD